MPRVIGQRIEQRQQQRDRQHQHQEFRQHGQVVIHDVARAQGLLPEILEGHKQVGRNPEQQEPAQAIAQRDQQLAQQIPVQQPHFAAA